MKQYEHITDALRAALLSAARGYTLAVTAVVPEEKVEGIAAKWADVYGTMLPAWKRHARRVRGLPCAWACAMPEPSKPGYRRLLLMSTEYSADSLDKRSPWLRENFKPLESVYIGDYVIKRDKRPRGDSALTVRLSPACYAGLEAYWRALAAQQQFDNLAMECMRAVAYYPLFGGVRRQLRRLIRGYKKLYEKKAGGPWPGPDPERLPAMIGFKRAQQK